LAQRHELRTVIDDGHATGALGPGGGGALAEEGLEDQVDVIVGSLSQALGSYGAFVACDHQMTRYLLNAARTFIFSTALPPPALAVREESRGGGPSPAATAPARREALIRQGFDVGASSPHIAPLIIGDAELAVLLCAAARARGVFAGAARPPAVPALTARLRV